jgi:hypothetical protein
MDNKKDIFGGFEEIASSLIKEQQQEFDPNIDQRDFPIEDGLREEDGGIENEEEPNGKNGGGTSTLSEKDEKDKNRSEENPSKLGEKDEEEDDYDKDSQFEEEVDKDELEGDASRTETDFDIGEVEPELSAFIQEKLYNKFGWELKDDEKKFESTDDVVDFISKVIEENSVPEFANEEIATLNEFVSNGGKLKDYYTQMYSGVDIDNINLDSEANQILTIRESLSVQGQNQDKISKRIERYKDTGILKDEAEEAVEFLKGYRKENSEKLLQEQQKIQEGVQKQQQKFVTDVQSYVNSLKDIKGISLNQSDKRAILEYSLRPDGDGKTKYQKEYANSLIKNFVESVFFTMKGDKLISDLSKKAGSKAAIDLKKKLETKTKRMKGIGDEGSNGKSSTDYSIFDTISSQISKPNF